mgnify:CR=1 FL=1
MAIKIWNLIVWNKSGEANAVSKRKFFDARLYMIEVAIVVSSKNCTDLNPMLDLEYFQTLEQIHMIFMRPKLSWVENIRDVEFVFLPNVNVASGAIIIDLAALRRLEWHHQYTLCINTIAPHNIDFPVFGVDQYGCCARQYRPVVALAGLELSMPSYFRELWIIPMAKIPNGSDVIEAIKAPSQTVRRDKIYKIYIKIQQMLFERINR